MKLKFLSILLLIVMSVSAMPQTVISAEESAASEPVATGFSEVDEEDASVVRSGLEPKHPEAIQTLIDALSVAVPYAVSIPSIEGESPEPKSYEEVKHYKEGDFSDLDLMAQIIWWENGMNSDRCMLLTGSVVLNRVADKGFPDSIYGVWSDKGQYSTYKYIGKDEDIPDHVYDLARELLEHGSLAPADVIYQAMFKQGSGVYEQIESSYSKKDIEYFCYR